MILKIFYASLVVGSLIAVKIMSSPGKIISVEELTVKTTLIGIENFYRGRCSFVFRGEEGKYYRETFYPNQRALTELSIGLRDHKIYLLRLVSIKRDNRSEFCARTIRDQEGNSFTQEDNNVYIDGSIVPSCPNSIEVSDEPLGSSV